MTGIRGFASYATATALDNVIIITLAALTDYLITFGGDSRIET